MPGTRVISIKSGEPYDVYIGHQMPPFMSPTGYYLPRSIWRNPFNRAFWDGLITRQEAIERYLVHVLLRPDLMARLPELEGKVLACWCKPEPCHGDVLVRLVENPA
jgi:Domain of unknown function (DUF4326)